MRKIIFSFLLISIALITNGQIKKGSTTLGGQLSFFSQQIENDYDRDQKGGNVGVSVGKAIKDNTVIGVGFGYSWNSYFYGYDSSSNTSHRYDIGAFFRKYKNLGKDFYLFGQLDGGYISGSEKAEYPNPENDTHSITNGGRASVSMGISYNIFRKMQVELTMPGIIAAQYTVTKGEKNDPAQNTREKSYNFYSNLTNNNVLGYLTIGVRFIL